MSLRQLLLTLGKLLIGGLVFFVGYMLGGIAAALLGIPLPTMPAEIDPAQAAQSLPLVGLLMTALLGIFSRQSGIGFLPRWVILGLFSWTAYGLNNFLESLFFLPDMATSYVLVVNFIACFACSAAAAWLFKPAAPVEPFWAKARAFFSARSEGSWAWRLLGGLAAFPAAYFIFGWMVAPFVIAYYEQQYAGLALPTQGTMLILALIRSLLFLLTILPLLVAWKGSRMVLFLALGGGLFLMVGGMNMLQAIWLPVGLRAAHSLEILADSFAHAAALVFLLVPGARVQSQAAVITRSAEAR